MAKDPDVLKVEEELKVIFSPLLKKHGLGWSNKNLNTYNQTYEKAKQYINSKHRVDKIYQYLIHNLNNKKLINQIEKVIINEGRKF